VNDGHVTKVPCDEAREAFEMWSKRYDQALTSCSDTELHAVGQMIFSWLARHGAGSALISPEALTLEIRIDGARSPDDPFDGALLDVPWELLAGPNGYFAADDEHLFVVTRKIVVQKVEPRLPEHGTLSLLFMSAVPRGQEDLSFELQEARIRDAASKHSLQIMVEDGGKFSDFAWRIQNEGPFHAFHFSCHGKVFSKLGPRLAFEREDGGDDLVDPHKIEALLDGAVGPSLVFVDACDTDQVVGTKGSKRSTSFIYNLAWVGCANVVGWHRRVSDPDANDFAPVFYGHLARGETVPRAAAMARTKLFLSPSGGSDWHKARFYLGPQGGGALVNPNKPTLAFANAGWEESFRCQGNDAWPIDVAGAFVGRRKQLNDALKALRGDAPGVLIHGMAGMGKTFLARRIASRMTGHKTVVVDKFDAKHIFDSVVAAWSPTHIIEEHQKLSDALAGKPGLLCQALEELLAGPLAKSPILLVMEGLERIVDVPTASSAIPAIREEYRAALIGVLSAFAKTKSGSRLILTSRYRFVLPDDKGTDLAAQLSCVPLCPMTEGERQKQRHAAAFRLPTLDPDSTLMKSLDGEAGGHPGLQATLMATNAGINFAQVNSNAIEKAKWIAKVNAFAGERGLLALLDALTLSQRMMLAVVGIFSPGLAIPRSVVEQIGLAAGIQKPAAELDRLLDLGLVVDFGAEEGVARVGANGMVNLLLVPTELENVALPSGLAVALLWDAWSRYERILPKGECAVELCRLALAVPTPSLLSSALRILGRVAAGAARFLRDANGALFACEQVLMPAIDKLATPSPELLRIACECAEVAKLEPLWELAVKRFAETAVESDDKAAASLHRARRAGHWMETNKSSGNADLEKRYYKEASEAYKVALETLNSDDKSNQKLAAVCGEFADFITPYATPTEVLSFRQFQLNLFETLGDDHSTAETAGSIACCLAVDGRLGEALECRERQMKAQQRAGDLCGETRTKEIVADTFIQLKRMEQALEVCLELRQIYRRDGDEPREVAVLWKIADIHQLLENPNAALKIYEDDVLPLIWKNPDQKKARSYVIGTIFGLEGTLVDWKTGLAKATLGMEKARESGDDASFCLHARVVAEIRLKKVEHLSKDDLAEINGFLREAFERAVKASDEQEIRLISRLLGWALFALGKTDEAEQAFKFGIQLCVSLGNPDGAHWLSTARDKTFGNE
jgi:tetratricopeptide (TPR) repeat protein